MVRRAASFPTPLIQTFLISRGICGAWPAGPFSPWGERGLPGQGPRCPAGGALVPAQVAARALVLLWDSSGAQVPTLGPAEPQASGLRTPTAVQTPARWPLRGWYSAVWCVLVPLLTAGGHQDESLVSLFAHPKKWVIPPTSKGRQNS